MVTRICETFAVCKSERDTQQSTQPSDRYPQYVPSPVYKSSKLIPAFGRNVVKITRRMPHERKRIRFNFFLLHLEYRKDDLRLSADNGKGIEADKHKQEELNHRGGPLWGDMFDPNRLYTTRSFEEK